MILQGLRKNTRGEEMRTPSETSGLLSSPDLLRSLAADVDRAAEEGRPYAIVACMPQRLFDQGDAVIEAAAASLRDLLRDDDIPGLFGRDQCIVIGLPDTALDGARVLAHRLKSDLGLRTAHLGTTVWMAGYACLPDDGTTAEELLRAARHAVTGSRGHFS